MSTGCECAHIEVEPGRWYYLLEDYMAPKNAWDWREYASCWGPFPSEEASHEHRRRHHANPGGYSTSPYREGFELDDVLAALLAEARL